MRSRDGHSSFEISQFQGNIIEKKLLGRKLIVQNDTSLLPHSKHFRFFTNMHREKLVMVWSSCLLLGRRVSG